MLKILSETLCRKHVPAYGKPLTVKKAVELLDVPSKNTFLM
jgi:hypothetical protein